MGQNLWKVLIRPDLEELENAERMEVARAANELEVGEFQLIQLAYRERHGGDMPDGMIDTLFYAYMIENDVPHWVRHYARQVLRLAEAGRLDRHCPQYHRYDPKPIVEPEKVRHRGFTVATVFLILTVGGGVLLASHTTKKSATLLPPYFSQDDLKKTSGEVTPRLPRGNGS